MIVRGQEYIQIGSYVLLQKPYLAGKVIGKVVAYTYQGYPAIKIIYAEDENGQPATKHFGSWIHPPLIEVELFTGDMEAIEAKMAAHML